MAYLALYRKFRPAGFDGLIGQEHIVKILQSQIKSGNIGHAYLFCGSRGTGKTSAAKIFARAVNCLTPVNGSPCNRCEVCNALSKSNNMDVLEIDAASNNKVEEVRDIRENVQYPPVSGRFKVYIIDEVHMLTDSAFNALLKTLEEPPKHALFILATTEVHKLPATILSRCMRFDFKLVPVQKITELLQKIFAEINKPYEIAALREIARAAEGSVRDSLSIADMCVSLSDSKLKYSDVLEVLSASDRAKIISLGDSIIQGNTGEVLLKIEELASSGKSIPVASKDLLMYFRDLLVIKNVDNPEELLPLPPEVLQVYKNSADLADYDKLIRYIELFSAQESLLKYSLNPRISFESAALKAASPNFDKSNDALKLRIKDLEAKTASALALIDELSKKLSNGTYSASSPVKATGQPAELNYKNNAATDEKDAFLISNKAVNPDNDFPPFDMDGLLPPPEEEDSGAASGGFSAKNKQAAPKAKGAYHNDEPIKAVSTEKVIKKADISQRELNKVFDEDVNSSNSDETAGAIWGNVIKTLRQSNAGLLYTMCSDLSAGIVGEDFIIYTDNQMVKDILTKPKNMDVLKSIINDKKVYNIRVESKGVSKPAAGNGIAEIKKLAGDKLIIK